MLPREASDPARLFIAYPFQPEAEAVLDSLILPILRRKGIRFVTGMDKERSEGNIVRNLRETIASCSAMVAVVVGRNPNVFFEIGVASALQKPCLLVASRPSDAGMMQGAYPIIITTPSKRAVQELGRHLNVLNRILESACA